MQEAEDREQGFAVIGVGASAGGLEAFEKFFTNMPKDHSFAFIVIQHMEAGREPRLPELLQRYTAMSVKQANDGMRIEANHIYVIPPGKDIAVAGAMLRVLDRAVQQGLWHPIDSFLRSLAEEYQEQSGAIILSGTGADGTLGIREINSHGGMVMVQHPKSAKFDGMPSSSIATGLVDYILEPQQMPGKLIEYFEYPSRHPAISGVAENNLKKIITVIRRQSGHDFSLYKRSTIMRRIERRVKLHQLSNIAQYAKFLQDNPQEVGLLFKDMLIRVTSFFRELNAFKILAEKVIPQLLAGKSYDVPARVWVCGCCTGEEAYSIAIMLAEHIEAEKINARVQIFATDIDSGAIAAARLGIYPETISVDVSAERLRKWFVHKGTSYQIKKELREMVVFAEQDVNRDAPFSKMDLVSCRNLLIYLEPQLQDKLLHIFHYAINTGGFLFLGSSESLGKSPELFSSLNNQWKIFQRKGVSAAAQKQGFTPRTADAVVRMPHGTIAEMRMEEPDIGKLTEKLLARRSPPAVVVSEEGEILYFHGRTGAFLEPPAGRPSTNIIEMAKEGLKAAIGAAIKKVRQEQREQVVKGLEVRDNGIVCHLTLTVAPVGTPAANERLMLVMFAETPVRPVKKTKTGTKGKNVRTEELENELAITKDRLASTVDQLQSSNEELVSANEELQSYNEELQSTNEELETSREELQSVNEELITVNAELQSKIDELTQAGNDMSNLFNAAEVATVFVDNDLRIKRFTPQISKIFSVITTDIGRPISDFTHNLSYELFIDDIRGVLSYLNHVEKEVTTKDNQWFLMRMRPYLTSENVVAGVVLTFVDITGLKSAQGAIRQLKGIVETVRHPLLVLDSQMRILNANRAFCEEFRVTSQSTEGRMIYELGNRQWDIPELHRLLEEILPKSTEVVAYKVTHEFPQIGMKTMVLNAREILEEGKGTQTILLSIEAR